MKKWIVTIKGSWDKQAHEIAVEYGDPLDSWGWFSQEKICVSVRTHEKTNSFVWDKLVVLAQELCEYMNNNHPNGIYPDTPENKP